MRYIAAYLLLQIGGNASPKAGDITKLLSTVGIDCDSDRLDKLISELDGKSIDELILAGSSKLASVPSGGGGGGGAAPAAAAASGGGGGEAPKEEEKKEEPKVRPRVFNGSRRIGANEVCDYRKSPTTIWASGCSTKRRMYVCLLVGTRHTTRVLLWLPSCQCSTSTTFTQTHSLLINVNSKEGCPILSRAIRMRYLPYIEVPNWLMNNCTFKNPWNPKPSYRH